MRSLRVVITSIVVLVCGAGCAPRRDASFGDGQSRDHVRPRTLVLYDDSGPYAWLGELYATGYGVLASHFGSWTAMPVAAYRRGVMGDFDAALYVGSTHAEALPADFTDDVLRGSVPVVWIDRNIEALATRSADAGQDLGFVPRGFDKGPFHTVMYKGVPLARAADATEGVLAFERVDTTRVKVLATAVRDDGSSVPWALRVRTLTYVAENPLAYVTPGDRSLALCDLLFDVLAPSALERHRAVVRIEDVSPRSSPASLREIADLLAARRVPYSVALIPVFADPNGAHGPPGTTRLRDAPDVVSALRYMLDRGGSLVVHGYTHQSGRAQNPYDGSTGADFEFYRAHVDASDHVVLDGPVAGDSEAWATERVERAIDEITSAGLPRPRAFEYPHYAGSAADSRAIARILPAAFQRPVFFAGARTGEGEAPARSLALVLPFVVDDVYGFRLVPENLGNYVPVPYNQQPVVGVDDLLRHARALHVVRDGVAGFFFHATAPPGVLASIVDGVAGAGYSYVSLDTLLDEVRSAVTSADVRLRRSRAD